MADAMALAAVGLIWGYLLAAIIDALMGRRKKPLSPDVVELCRQNAVLARRIDKLRHSEGA